MTSLLFMQPAVTAKVRSITHATELQARMLSNNSETGRGSSKRSDPSPLASQIAKRSDQANPKLATRRDDDDRLPIHWAASYNRQSIVEILAERKDFDVDAQDGSGWTPLMIASSIPEGDALVDLLLGKDADPNVKTNSGQTALHFAASKSHLDTARKLIAKKATTRVKDKRGQLPLHRAAAVGNVPITQLLLENRSPVNASDVDGLTALHHGVWLIDLDRVVRRY